MVAAFSLILVMIAMLVVIAQSVGSVVYSSSQIQRINHELMLEKLWIDAIERKLVQPSPTEPFMAPVGVDLLDITLNPIGHGFPSGIGAPLANAWNQPIHYCALSAALSGAPDTVVTLRTGLTYGVETIGFNGLRYAYKTTSIPSMEKATPSIVAFVISPRSQGAGLSCDDIRYNALTGIHSVPGADAKVIPIIAPVVVP
jgi:hypothetical protein